MGYLAFDPDLLMNTQYLTENMAYFLGGIYSSEEQIMIPDGRYKIAPVRYNYGAASELEIAEHFELVSRIAEKVNGQTLMADNIRGTPLDSGKNRMPGFSTFFRATTLDELVDLIPALRDALRASDWNVLRSFLVGVFDGRSSADIDKKNHNVRMLALDCISDDVGAFLSEMVELSGIRYNYNKHRDRLEGGRPRNPQLRIKDVDDFMARVGLISPRRVNLLKAAYEHNYSVRVAEDFQILPGLKTLHLR